MKNPAPITRCSAFAGWFRRGVALMTMIVMLSNGAGSEVSLTEYQVKSLCLLNFTKYVEWPPSAFFATNSPIIIGVYGEGKILDDLQKAVASRTGGGRNVVVRQFTATEDLSQCHILFISVTDKKQQTEILNKVRSRPVLTVGESESFFEAGGVINFTMKEGKVRLEVNLDAAREANLQVSSKLLGVADTVKGKTR